jgi:hypothetical protein
MTWVIGPWLSHKNKLKNNYEAQSLIKKMMKLKK